MVLFTVARTTVQDLIRRRVFVILALFAIAMIVLSFPLRELTIGQWTRLITDIGLGATDLTVTLLAVFLGASLISGEFDRRTFYPLLAKPLRRSTFVVGKFLGLLFILTTISLLMGAGVAAMLGFAKQHINFVILSQNVFAIIGGAAIVAALAVALSCFTSTTLAATFALTVAAAGHLTDNLRYFGGKAGGIGGKALTAICHVLPDLERLNLKDFASHGDAIPSLDLTTRLVYALLYTAATLAFGSAVFSRRDFK